MWFSQYITTVLMFFLCLAGSERQNICMCFSASALFPTHRCMLSVAFTYFSLVGFWTLFATFSAFSSFSRPNIFQIHSLRVSLSACICETRTVAMWWENLHLDDDSVHQRLSIGSVRLSNLVSIALNCFIKLIPQSLLITKENTQKTQTSERNCEKVITKLNFAIKLFYGFYWLVLIRDNCLNSVGKYIEIFGAFVWCASFGCTRDCGLTQGQCATWKFLNENFPNIGQHFTNSLVIIDAKH